MAAGMYKLSGDAGLDGIALGCGRGLEGQEIKA